MHPLYQDFKDKRDREWEWFIDIGYFDQICVRLKSDRSFNSDTNFHFNTSTQASQFVELLKISS
jgi:hypothetical protein